MKRFLARLVLGLALALPAFASGAAYGDASGSLLVLGVIATADQTTSVALLKNQRNGQTFAARVGQGVERGTVIRRVTREFVYFETNGHLEKVGVGESLGEGASADTITAASGPALDKGLERQGNTVKVSSQLREHLVKRELNKVLMQAAAVPYYVNGALQGFRLWEIDPGSLFEKVGFVNGDIITAINGQTLTDVGMTIRMLQSLRDETRADVTFTRAGAEQTMQIVVQ